MLLVGSYFKLALLFGGLFFALQCLLAFKSSFEVNRLCLVLYTSALTFALTVPLKDVNASINLTLDPFSCYNALHTLENVLIFVPFSYYSARVVKRAFAFCVAFAFACEFAQLSVVGRCFDVNDVYANFLGVMLGIIIAKLVKNEISNSRYLLERNQF